ncbi:acyltransferase [Streptomyces sp. BK239]|uniref:acyltransferase family protein n=1 Tax=Streptomyces sp. BK239 TaxID=2512155 RepID=UPI00102C86B4|nr:acyltransferase [Streptomyces sp. BK239]RZU15020.1 peptidoglycan/LPS O-acetylase OafA/YrhL [Streptomyces sp. BK239]
MHRVLAIRWSHGTVAELLTGRNNSLGLLRMCLALAVVVSHARILGYGGKEYLHHFSGGQTELGKLSVYGFFVLSGLLVTRSGARLPVGRFLWHRALRILPGLWVCLTVTAFVIAPFLYWRLHSTLDGFNGPRGPFEYLQANWSVTTMQPDIARIMADGRSAGRIHAGAFNGALWSLRYEVTCYLGVAVLAVTGVLARARRVVLLITLVLGWLVIRHASTDPFWAGQYSSHYLRDLHPPLVGQLSPTFLIYLGFAFGLGAVIEVARHRIPVSDPLGLASLIVLVGSLHYGYLFTVGIPAFAYLLVWLAVRLPAPCRRIGARNDYSYGIYIYGFPVQQALALLGGTRWGIAAYLALTLAFTLLLAAASWHFVERPAMRLKDLRLRRGGRDSDPVEPPADPKAVMPQPVGAVPANLP